MPHDLGLLFQPVSFERPTWFKGIVIAAQWMPAQDEVPAASGLNLPDVHHLVDEVPLAVQVRGRKIIAVAI